MFIPATALSHGFVFYFPFSDKAAQNVIKAVEVHLPSLVRVAFMESGRSVARLCTKLVILCLEYVKSYQE